MQDLYTQWRYWEYNPFQSFEGVERRSCGVFRSNRWSALVTFQWGRQTARQVTEELGHVGAQNPKQECYGFSVFLYHRHVFLQFIFINEVNFVFFYIPPHFHFFYNEISVRMGVKTYRHMDMYIQTTLRQTSTYLYTKK